MSAPRSSPSGRTVRTGRTLAGLLLLFTSLEFLLGIYVNLYTSCLPNGARYVFISNPCPSSTEAALQAHVAVGAILVILAIALLVWATRARSPQVLGAAFGGFLGIVIAALGGYEFLAGGGAVFSLLMALGFLMAFGAYFRAGTVLQEMARSSPGPRDWSPPGPSGSSP